MIEVPPGVIPSGDRSKAMYYAGYGRKLLAELKADLTRMYVDTAAMGRLMSGSVSKTLPGGGNVTVTVRGENSYINLFMPFGGIEEETEVIEEESEKYYLVFVMGNWTGGLELVEPEPDDAKTFVWDINKNDFAAFIDPDDLSDDPAILTYPCEYRKVRKFVVGDGSTTPGHEVQYDNGRPNENAQIYQDECYRLWVGYGRTSDDMVQMRYPHISLPPGCSSELGYCYPEQGSPCLIGYHNSCSSGQPDNLYPFTYACVGTINDFASVNRRVDYDAYSGSACQGTGVAGMVAHTVKHRYIHALLPIENLNSFGAPVVFEQSHTGVINTNNGRDQNVCLRVDRDNYLDYNLFADIAGTYDANPSGCKLYYLNEHEDTYDSGVKRSIVLPLMENGNLVKLRNEAHLNQSLTEYKYYGSTATGVKSDGSPMFGDATTSSSRHTINYGQDGDNLSTPYCVPRDGVFKNVMYQFYCSWGTIRDVWEYVEGSSRDGGLASPMVPVSTTYFKSIEVAACCSMFGVEDPEGPYAHLAEENPIAMEHNPTLQELNPQLEDALRLWLTGEKGVEYNEQDDDWNEYDLLSPRPNSEGLAGKIYHHFCKVTEKTEEEVEVDDG